MKKIAVYVEALATDVNNTPVRDKDLLRKVLIA